MFLALLGTPLRDEGNFSLLVWVRVRTNFTVSIDQPRTVLVMLQPAYPLDNFLRKIGSYIALSWGLLGQNKSSMEQNM